MTVNPCAVRSSSNNSRLDALSSATRIVPDSGGINFIELPHSHRTSNVRLTWDAEPKLVTGVTVPWPMVQFTKCIACNNRAATRYERLGGTCVDQRWCCPCDYRRNAAIDTCIVECDAARRNESQRSDLFARSAAHC